MPFTISDSLKTPTTLFKYISEDATFAFSRNGTEIKKINGGSYNNGGMVTKIGFQGQQGLRFQVESMKKGDTQNAFAPLNILPTQSLSEVGGYGFMWGASDITTWGPTGFRTIPVNPAAFNTFYRFRLFFVTDSSIEFSINGNVVDVVENIDNQGGDWFLSLNGSFYNQVSMFYKNVQIKQF